MSNKELLEVIDVLEYKLEGLRSIKKETENNKDIKQESKLHSEYKYYLKLRSVLVEEILSDDILKPVIERCKVEKEIENYHYTMSIKDSMVFIKAVDYKLEELTDIKTDYEFKRELDEVERIKEDLEFYLRLKMALTDELLNSKELDQYKERCTNTKDVVTPEKAIRYRYLMNCLKNN